MVVLCIGFAILSYLCYIQGWNAFMGNLFWQAVLVTATLMFALGAMFMAKRAANPLPALILDDEGIIDNAGLIRGAKHLWSNIERIEQRNVYGSTLILVYLKDPHAFIDAQSGIKKKMLTSTYNQQGTPVSIPGKALEGAAGDLLKLLRSYLEKSSVPGAAS